MPETPWTQYVFVFFSALLGALYLALPALTRPGLFFAVTVDPAFRKSREGRRIAALYRVAVLAATLAAIAVTLWLGPTLHPEAMVWPLVAVLGAATASFLWARSRVLPHATPAGTAREAALAPRAAVLPGGLVLQAGPFVILLAAAGWLLTRWNRLPERFPVHWNASGLPDAVAAKGPTAVFGPLASSALVCLLLLAIGIAIVRWSPRVAARGGAAAREGRFRRLVLQVLLGGEYLVAATAALTASLPVFGPRATRWMVPLILGMTVVFVLLITAALLRSGQGGVRLPEGEPDGTRGLTDGREDRFWKLGLFYVNPSDPAVFVEKRFGLGYTLNFGNRWAWLIVAVILIPILVAVAAGLTPR